MMSPAQPAAASDGPSLVSDFLASLTGEKTTETPGFSDKADEPASSPDAGPVEPAAPFSAVFHETDADDNAPTVYDSIAES